MQSWGGWGSPCVSQSGFIQGPALDWCWHPWWSTLSLLLRFHIIFLLKGITVLAAVLRTHNWTQREREREGKLLLQNVSLEDPTYLRSHCSSWVWWLPEVRQKPKMLKLRPDTITSWKKRICQEYIGVWKLLKQGERIKKGKSSLSEKKPQQNR